MTKMRTPTEDHAQFDAICARVGEWEALPAIASAPTDVERAPEHDVEHDHEPSDVPPVAELDGLILAGLVSP
jgi:hypothetical protein